MEKSGLQGMTERKRGFNLSGNRCSPKLGFKLQAPRLDRSRRAGAAGAGQFNSRIWGPLALNWVQGLLSAKVFPLLPLTP